MEGRGQAYVQLPDEGSKIAVLEELGKHLLLKPKQTALEIRVF